MRRVGGEAGRRIGRESRATRLLILLFLFLYVSSIAVAQNAYPLTGLPSAQRPPAPPGSDLTVYLMTMGPGKRVWERFGHNAIWIHDPVRGTDQTYNYGLFDFRQHNFLLRFAQGRMWYWMQGFPAQSYVESYRRANRSVWVQELEMAPAARLQLQRFLEWNERPEHRFYHYDYYRDNCSTRVRDALDRALGGRIRELTAGMPTGRTYRFHTLRLTTNDPPIYTSLLVALGHPVDRPISAWEEMFLPLAMREHLRKITVIGPGGAEVPLVRAERTLFESTEPAPPAEPPFWVPYYLIVGVAIGGTAFGLGREARSSRFARTGFILVVWVWALLAGIAGLILAGLWGLTDHAAAYNNENLLQADLLALGLLWWLPRLGTGSGRSARSALRLAGIVAGISLLGLVLKLFPPFYQVNGSVMALALPIHAGVLGGLWQWTRGQEPRTRRNPSLASG